MNATVFVGAQEAHAMSFSEFAFVFVCVSISLFVATIVSSPSSEDDGDNPTTMDDDIVGFFSSVGVARGKTHVTRNRRSTQSRKTERKNTAMRTNCEKETNQYYFFCILTGFYAVPGTTHSHHKISIQVLGDFVFSLNGSPKNKERKIEMGDVSLLL